MKVKLTNEKIFNVVFLLKSKYPNLSEYDKRFNFAITRSLSTLRPIAVDIFQARNSGIVKYNEFEQRKANIIKMYAKLDINKNPININGDIQFNSEEAKEQAQIELNNLLEEYKDVLEERKKEIELYNEILQQEIEVDIVQCKFEAIPKDFDFDLLRFFIKESDEEIEALI